MTIRDVWNTATAEEAWACLALVLLLGAVAGIIWWVMRDRP